MDCPACERLLSEVELDRLRVDVCRAGCGGVWFDRFELQKVDEQHESAGEDLLRHQPDVELDGDKQRKHVCPRDGAQLMRHFFTAHREVEVDTCPQCAGIWLDAGELARIRHADRGDEERARAADTVLLAEFAPQLEAMRRTSEAARSRAEGISRALRWICPSHWIPGKQRGGAF
jgi:Zn-finger nucleic acid-binding protein